MESSSPPPPPPPPPESRPRDPESPPPPTTYYERVSEKRRNLEAERYRSIFHSFQVQTIATSLLESNGVASLQNLIQEFNQAQSITEKSSKRRILDSLSYHYPYSFSLKLVNLLFLHPPLIIRNVVVLLLRNTLIEIHGDDDNRRISCAMLVKLRTPILDFFKHELEDSLLPPLSETIANLASRIYAFPLGGWLELLEYIVSCVSLNSNDDDSVLNQRKGLMLLADLSSYIVRNGEFWKNHYRALFRNLEARMLDETANENFLALTFNALVTMIGMAESLGEFRIGSAIFSILLHRVDRHSNKDIVLKRVQALGDFVTLDDGEVRNESLRYLKEHIRKEIVFRVMLRIADKEDASEDLRCAAVQVLIKYEHFLMGVLWKLSYADAKRALKVSLYLLLGIENDALWYEFEMKRSILIRTSKRFELGKSLLNWLFSEVDGSTVVPMAIELLKTTYAASHDWKERHAGMIVIAEFANEYNYAQDVVKSFVEVASLVMFSLNDRDSRVLWAAMSAMRCLSENKLIPHVQYHMNFFSKLIRILEYRLCLHIKVEAVRAIRSLVANCRLDKMTSSDKKVAITRLDELKVQALETLESVAVLIPTDFQKYYDAAKEALKAILFDDHSIPSKFLHAKSLECMSTILLRNEFVNFTNEDAVKVMDSLISVQRKLSKTDLSERRYMLKALQQFFQFAGVDIDLYIDKLMPMLLQSAQVGLDLKAMNRSKLNFGNLFDDERVQALNILSHCAVRSSQVFSPHMLKVSKVFAGLLSFSWSKTQKASISALPNLLLSVNSGEKDKLKQSNLYNSIVQSLVEALHKEADANVSIRMLKTLPTCIQISGSAFSPELIKMITDEINYTLSMWSHKIIKSKRAPGTSEGRSEYLPYEEIIQSAKVLIITMAETFKGGLSPYVDDLFSTVSQLWENYYPDRVKAIAVSIFNIIVPHFPDKLQLYHDKYTHELLKDRDGSLLEKWETARGIGICAEFGGHNFKTLVNVAISKLYSLIKHGPSIKGEESRDGAMIADMAVSALGKICEFHRENIDGPEAVKLVIRRWLNFLPLTNDLDEARNAHAQLSEMLKREDADFFGPNMENLPKIVSIFRAILPRSEELVTEETFSEIIEFLDKHDGGLL